MDSSTETAISLDNTQVRNLRNPGQTFNEAWITWDPPVDSSFLVDYEITCPGRDPVRTPALEYTATGLVPDATYLFKVQPKRSHGSPASSSSINIVTRDRVPPTRPRGLKLKPFAPGKVTISWGLSQDNVGVSFYEIRRNEEAWMAYSGHEYVTTELKAGEIFEVRAVDAAGNRSVKAALHAKDVTAPSKPTQLRVTDVTHTSVTLEWAVASDDSGRVAYGIYCDNTVIDIVEDTHFVATGLTAMTTYFFKVRARDGAGNGSDSDPLTVTTADSSVPSKPTNLMLVDWSGRIGLMWDPSPGAEGYEVFRNGQFLDRVKIPAIAPVDRAEPYSFKVRALGANGKYGDFGWLSAGDNQPPSKPGNLQATSITDNSIIFKWAPSSDNTAVAGYRVFLNDTTMPIVDGTTFTAIGLTENTTYTLRVQALDAAGNATDSDPLPVTTTGPDTTPPSKPTNLRATTTTHTAVVLEWDAASDQVGVVGYQVYKGHAPLITVSGTRHMVIGLEMGSTYIFKVRAMDAAGNGTDSDTLPVTTTKPDTTPPSKPNNFNATPYSNRSVLLKWDAASDNVRVDRYEIFRDGIRSAIETGTQILVPDLLEGTSYLFEVRALDAASNAGEFARITYLTPGSDTYPPSTPGNLRAFAVTSNSARLSWSPSTDNVAVTGYEIRRSEVLIDTVTELQYHDTNLNGSTTYTFEVRAMDAAGNRSLPTSVQVTTLAGNGPINLKLERSHATVGVLQWEPPVESGGVTGYRLSRDGNIVGELSETYHLFLNLTPGATHLFEVRAIRNGQYSDPAYITG